MSNSSIFSLTPTFTQGLLLGQVSILLLLALILKYLFLEPIIPAEDSQDESATQSKTRAAALSLPIPQSRSNANPSPTNGTKEDPSILAEGYAELKESAEWFNVIIHQVIQAYRLELRETLSGAAGDEAARIRVERWINARRGTSLLDVVQIHQVTLGNSAPCLSNARVRAADKSSDTPRIECDISYTDTVSISLSTSLLFHYPTPSFARLPISLSLSLSLFSGVVTLTPPSLSHPIPCLTLALNPNFTLNLTTTSLMGSRAKLSDVPKVHEMIEQRIRSVLAERGTWKVVLPGVRAKDVVDMLEKKQS